MRVLRSILPPTFVICLLLFTVECLAASVGNRVWNDRDANGVQDSGEPGVAGVAVALQDCSSYRILARKTSDSSGKFLFSGVSQGSYRLRFTSPESFKFTLYKQGSKAWLDSDANPADGVTPCVQLAANQEMLGLDAGLVSTAASTPTGKLNVLFIGVDDLRPEVGAYGVKAIKTPAIDRIARQGVTFNRAYTQMATCSPSRTSLMTGLRPDTTRVTDLKTNFRNTVPSVVTLPEWFKKNGYRTQGICKIFHKPGLDDSRSWTEPSLNGNGPYEPKGPDGKRLAFAALDAAERNFGDYKCADYAINSMRKFRNQPFFIAVGFKKPHLPFLAPRKYFNMYDKWQIPEAPNLFRATNAPSFAFENATELKGYSGIPSSPSKFSAALRRDLKLGYYAATSFVDAQIQRVLNELDQLGLANKTIVVLWGDHGWHLGEQNDWGKHTNFEIGTRVPLIIKAPGKPAGRTSDALVELVDVYPTLAQLAGLPIPTKAQHGGYEMQGDSLVNFINNPGALSTRGAFSQWRRGGYNGHSIRTDDYRFTEWKNGSGHSVFELYDHRTDPNETVNVANQRQYASILPALKSALAAGGKKDLPASLAEKR